MMATISNPGRRGYGGACHAGPAREHAGRIAPLDRHEVRRHQHAAHEHRRGQQTRGDQRADRHRAAGRKRIDDHVVAGGHERPDERRMGRHVDGVVGVVPLLLHHRDHHGAHRRHVGHGRAAHAAEQRARHHVGHAQAAAHVTRCALGEPHDLVGHAAVQHQLAAEDEERDREEREHVHPGHHLLEQHTQRQALVEDGADRRESDREGHRNAQDEQAEERQAQDGQCHDGTTSFPSSNASTCSIENEMTSRPEITSGA